ncbi:MAG TPA: alpha/beta fold hydrolase, partial [Ilumatobacteraceae bacterium]|nr:alpha/beta fold hydrolase [Ilumatobacteraceae bacterium]
AHVTTSDGVRLHYETWGFASRPAVLFIQGLGTDKHGWDLQRIALAPFFRVIAFDNRGAGRSDKPEGPYSLERMADDAIEVLDACGIERAHVVGASMGGVITQLVYARHAHRVKSMTLACTACRHHPWRRQLLKKWAERGQQVGMSQMSREAARWVIGPRSFRRLLPAFGWLGPLALGRTPHSFAAQVDAILASSDDAAEMLSEVDVPTLVIVGNQDILTPRGDSEELAERIPGAELVVISGAAHGLMIEHASTFNSFLLDFLQRAEASLAAASASVRESQSTASPPRPTRRSARQGRSLHLVDTAQ